MSRFYLTLLLFFTSGIAGAHGASGATAAEDPFTIDGNKIIVTTDRFKVILDGLRITGVENRLTGEVYAAPQPEAATTPAHEELRDRVGVAIKRLGDSLEYVASIEEAAKDAGGDAFRAVGESAVTTAERNQKKKSDTETILRPGASTKIESTRIQNGVRICYTGLYSGKEAAPQMTLTLDCTIDPETGDLCLAPYVKGNIPLVNGVRDRGIKKTLMQMCNLAGEMNMVLPVDNGAQFNRANGDDKSRSNKLFLMPWPGSWQAAIFIAEGAKGCLAFWADEQEMKYGRTLSLAYGNDRWHTGFEFETNDVPWNCDEITGAVWRFNVFKGYWARAAEHYRRQCEKQWPEMQPLEKRKPEWASKARVMVLEPWPSRANKVMAKLPSGSHVVDFQPQCWLLGWDDMTTKKIYGAMDGIFPNGPNQNNPVRYEAREGFTGEMVGAAEKLGMHVFPYTNANVMLPNHPWKREKLGNRTDSSWLFWQRLYAELMDDVIKRYGATGIYQDCSWVGYGSPNIYGTPDSIGGAGGYALMQNYFRSLQPEIATMGERRQENTARGQHFALQISGWGAKHAHPIMASLQEPYCRSYNFFANTNNMDIDDIQGMLLSYWKEGVYLVENPLHEDRMNLRRGQIFTQEQLLNFFPETWEKDVLHYFKNKNGEEFRIIKKDGVRLIKLTPQGEQTYYVRLKGVNRVAAGGGSIEGWLAYDDNDHIIGLNPKATYCAFNDVKRPETRITALPTGVMLSRCVQREGFWITQLAPVPVAPPKPTPGEKPAPPSSPLPPQEVKVRIRSANPQVKFTGTRSVKKLAENEYELTVLCPGGFGAYWISPTEPNINQCISDFPALNTIQRKGSGLTYSIDRVIKALDFRQEPGDCRVGDEGSMFWLFKIPVEANWFVAKCGAGDMYGDGAIYKVRVDGQEIWSLHCPAVIGIGKDGIGIPARTQKTGAVDLRPYQDQVVIFEMAIDGGGSEISEQVRWNYPHLTDTETPPEGAYEKATPVLKGKKGKRPAIKPSLELDFSE